MKSVKVGEPLPWLSIVIWDHIFLQNNKSVLIFANILDKPKVKLSEVVVHGPIGGDIEVLCTVDAVPRATITWHFSNNSQLFNAEKHRIGLVLNLW